MTQPITSNAAPPEDVESAPEQSQEALPKEVTCPICATAFDPRATKGRCPVCGEQVAPTALATRAVPWLTPTWAWVKAGGWRLVLVALMVIYEVALFIIVWQRFAAAHAF